MGGIRVGGYIIKSSRVFQCLIQYNYMSNDPLMKSIEMTIQSLRTQNKQLTSEVEGYVRIVNRLKTRIAELEAKAPVKPSRSSGKEDVPVESIVTKDTEAWGARDFLAYFQHLHLQWCGVPYHFSRGIWEAAVSQVKGLRQRYGLSNADMRGMFDFHFTKTFNEKFTPSIAYICGTAGVNRFYGSTRRTTTAPAISAGSGYTRRQLESRETWNEGEDTEGEVVALEKRLRQRKKR